MKNKNDELEKCYLIIAHIVHKYGDKYLPIFRRLHNERIAHAKDMALVEEALKLATDL